MKRQLLEDAVEHDTLKVNEHFAKKYEHNERRKHLEQGRLKYGDLISDDEEESDSSSSDDSDAELVNPKFEKKFIEVLTKIRQGDQDIKQTQGDIWKDEDFEDDKDEVVKEKKITLKDQIRKDVMQKIDRDESASEDSDGMFKKKGFTIADEQKKLKQAFQQAATGDDDFLIKKKIGVDEELQEYEDKPKKQAKLVTDKQLLARFFGDDAALDKSDKFLRQYILNEGWKDRGQMIKEDPADNEDEARDEEFEKFEYAMNFRYEDPNAATITSHARNALEQETLRRQENTRKLARDRKLQRKEDEKSQKRLEIQKLKQLKKEEIIDKLKKAEFIAGKTQVDAQILNRVQKELETDFVPDLYDKAMGKMFSDKYYEVEQDESDNEPQQIQQVLEDSQEEDLEQQMGKQIKQKVYENEVQQAQQEGYDMWFVCDECLKPVPAGQYRYDCQQCDNFCFCERCYKKNKSHLHSFSKSKVSANQGPPPNSDDLITKAYMRCTNCLISLIDLNKRVYTCKQCSPDPSKGQVTYWCKSCKDSTEHEHKRGKLKGVAGVPFEIVEKDKMTDEQRQQYLDSLFEEYHNLDYEDVIAGGILTRFKYTQVQKEDFGLSNEEILLLDDKQLNQVVSIKKYRPYNNQEISDQQKKVELYKVIQKKKEFKQDIQDGLDLVKQVTLASLEQQKAKHLKKKLKKQKKDTKLKKRKREAQDLEDNLGDTVNKRVALYD